MRRLLALTFIFALLPLTPAAAHQQLLDASPAADSVLTRVPEEIRLSFNQAVDIDLASLRLIGPTGEVALAPLEVPADAPKVLRARIAETLVAGSYSVEWLVTGDDGHPVRGEYRFTIAAGAPGLAVGGGTGAGGPADPGPIAPGAEAPPASHHVAAASDGFDSASPLYAAIRWLTFAGIVVAIGAVAFTLLLLPAMARRGAALTAQPTGPAIGRAAAIGIAAGAVLTLSLVLRLLAQSAALHGAAAAGRMLGTMLTSTFWGWGWLLQAGATLVLLAALWRGRTGSHGAWWVAAGAAVALAFTPALSGHAVATSALAVLSDGLHVLSAGGWLGTLLVMLLVALPLVAASPVRRREDIAALLAAFTPLALTFAGILTLTGIHAAWLHLPALSDLWTSAYGRTLLLKLAALGFVFALGAYNWRRASPALERGEDVRPLRRSATAEIVMGAVVLAVTAALVATPPPDPQRAMAASAHPSQSSAPASPSGR